VLGILFSRLGPHIVCNVFLRSSCKAKFIGKIILLWQWSCSLWWRIWTCQLLMARIVSEPSDDTFWACLHLLRINSDHYAPTAYIACPSALSGVRCTVNLKESMGRQKRIDRFLTNEIEAQNRFLSRRRRKYRFLRSNRKWDGTMGLRADVLEVWYLPSCQQRGAKIMVFTFLWSWLSRTMKEEFMPNTSCTADMITSVADAWEDFSASRPLKQALRKINQIYVFF